jgi:Fe2+-dicitrate sensor, membrane component
LRDRLADEDAETKADLESMWHLLGTTERAEEDAPALDDEWDALRRRRPEVSTEFDSDPDPPSSNGRAPPAGSSRNRAEREPVRSDRARHRGRWVGALAVVVMVVLVAAWVWHRPVTMTAAPGQQRTATLPDGSTVELNSGTSLTYRRGFQSWPLLDTERRRVHLDGEAFFAVEDGSRPFVVETVTARVVVKGTHFNVRTRPTVDSTTAVTVAGGRVQVQARGHPERAVMLSERGQMSRVQSDRLAPTSPQLTEVDPILAWRQDGFAVNEEPLVRVIYELEQRFDTTIRLHESVSNPHAPLTLYYPNLKPVDTILRDLCTALDLNYRPKSRGYEIFAGPNDQ